MGPALWPGEEVHDLGPFRFACGHRLERAEIRFRRFGELNAAHDNLVLVPSYYAGSHADLEWLLGTLLDPGRHCVVLVNMFGNGRSSSPAHGAMGLREQGWVLHHSDNIRAQTQLLRQRFGVERVALILGWSMGAQQAYQWAVQEPDRVERIFCVGGTARTGPHLSLIHI